jgi:hypothetical protein
MKEPMLMPDGHHYELSAISQAVARNGRSPITMQGMTIAEGLLDIALKQEIEESGFLPGNKTRSAEPGQFTVLANAGDHRLFTITVSPEMTITDLVRAIEGKSGTNFMLMVRSKVLAETAGNSVRGRKLKVKDYPEITNGVKINCQKRLEGGALL